MGRKWAWTARLYVGADPSTPLRSAQDERPDCPEPVEGRSGYTPPVANIGYLQVTRDCNQHCRFCSNPPSGLDRTLEEDKRLADDFVARGYEGVILTGGEPTLVGHLPDLIRHCVAIGLTPRLITNGQRIANPSYLDELYDAGLRIIHCSLHSHRPEVHNFITDHTKAWEYIVTAMSHCAERPDLSLRVNCVLNKHNADHLDQVMQFLVDNFANVHHVIFNGLDPSNERCDQNRDVYYRLRDIEVTLPRAMRILERAGVTFRVERVPLCYMLDHAHLSTETRKLIKREERMIHFLDGKGTVRQAPGSFYHRKHPRCGACSLDAICAGVFERGDMYDPEELYPVFVDAGAIRRRVLGDHAVEEPSSPAAATDRVAPSSVHLPVL
ncbi:MAG: radical SAM protein [Myxococcales bacterium]|nr:radical SAM protein [Myxococcales bacterium]